MYRYFLKVVVIFTLSVCLLTLAALYMGDCSSGDTISAFTTNTHETTDVWVMDVSRMQYVRLHVSGQGDKLPVWSTQERRLLYFPRN